MLRDHAIDAPSEGAGLMLRDHAIDAPSEGAGLMLRDHAIDAPSEGAGLMLRDHFPTTALKSSRTLCALRSICLVCLASRRLTSGRSIDAVAGLLQASVSTP